MFKTSDLEIGLNITLLLITAYLMQTTWYLLSLLPMLIRFL